MRLPNLLATPRGRLIAFFLLYVAEGIPSGFTGTAIATQMRRQGLEPSVIGAFIGALYLPWAFKWAFGPLVDVISVDRWGRRRVWILGTQLLMSVGLLAAMPIDWRAQLALFTAVLFAINVLAAIQDVAIDALAVDVLQRDEAGLANGLMFGGQYLGLGLGGAGVLFLTSAFGFQTAFLAVALSISLIAVLVAVPMREPLRAPRLFAAGSRARALALEMARFARDAGRAFVGSRAAFFAIFFALLPMGAYALAVALQSTLSVELGLDDDAVATLTLFCTILSAAFCMLGGWLSDRFGRRRTLALFIVGTTLPTIALAIAMQRFGWILPIAPDAPGRPIPSEELVSFFRWMALAYAAFQGLMYGVGTAIFMDVTTRRVAATQFTAYMAMSNLVYSYSAVWQGHAVERWGYPITLALDCAVGLVGLVFLALMGNVARAERGEFVTLVASVASVVSRGD